MLSKEDAIIVTGFTGIAACNFGDFQLDVERRLGRPVFTHEFGNKEFAEHIKQMYRSDFLAICSP